MASAAIGFLTQGGAANWGNAWTLSQMAVIKAAGFDTVTFDMGFSGITTTDVLSGLIAQGSANNYGCDITNAQLAAMASAAQQAGLNISLKPHLYPQNWNTCPGGIIGTNASYSTSNGSLSASWTYNGSSVNLTSPPFSLTTSGPGGGGCRVSVGGVSGALAYMGDVPNAYCSNYGQTAPGTWNHVTSVTNSTTLVMNNTPLSTRTGAIAYIFNDTAAASWFTNWRTICEWQLTVCANATAYGAPTNAPVTYLNVATEQDVTTSCYGYTPGADWRLLISNLRSANPGLKIFAGSGSGLNIPNCITFNDVCDYIGIDMYPRVVSSPGSGQSLATMQSGWASSLGIAPVITAWNPNISPNTYSMASYSASVNKPIYMGEVGGLSLAGMAYQPGDTNFLIQAIVTSATLTAGSSTITCTLPSSYPQLANFSNMTSFQNAYVSVEQGSSGSSVYIQANTQITNSPGTPGQTGKTLNLSKPIGGSGSMNASLYLTGAAPSQVDQATWFNAMLAETVGTGTLTSPQQTWFGGFSWFQWYFPNNDVFHEDMGGDFSLKSSGQAVLPTYQSPATVPTAPTIGLASSGAASATVNWSTPAGNGGSAITGYVITPYIGSTAQSTTTVGVVLTDVVTGLTNGTTYSFTVAAINAVGTGPASAKSNTVVPFSPPVNNTIRFVTDGTANYRF